MNFRQRIYESFSRDNYNLKVSNSKYHFRNMFNISNRKPEYHSFRIVSPSKLKHNASFQNYFVIKENELYKKIINDIRFSKVQPKMNNYFKINEEQLKEYKRKNKKLLNKQLSKDNIIYRKRLLDQKSMLRIKEIDKDYRDNHIKLVERTKKIQNIKKLILPRIQTVVNTQRKNELKRNKLYNNSIGISVNSIVKDAESLHQQKSQVHEPIIKNN